MKITTYLENHDAYIRIRELESKHLTDEEKTELDELEEAIQIFEDEVLLNFE